MPDVRKSLEVEIRLRSFQPMPSTNTKYRARMK
jgi:hypothetical protein